MSTILVRLLRMKQNICLINIGYYLGMVFIMKFLQHRKPAVPFVSLLLPGLIVQLILLQPLVADELMNVTEITECRKIEAQAERLLCYDTVSDGGIFNEQKLKEAQVESFGSSKMPKEKETKTVTKTETETGTESKIDTETETKTETKTEKASQPVTDISVDRIQVTIVRTQKNPNGITYFKTSDGQVWKQINSDNWSLAVPFEADIKSGVLGSFFLVPESGKSTRVRRVK